MELKELHGWKTYIIGIILLCTAIFGYIAKCMDTQTLMSLIAISLSSMGLRHGIANGKDK